jgi:hypothetical protein
MTNPKKNRTTKKAAKKPKRDQSQIALSVVEKAIAAS